MHHARSAAAGVRRRALHACLMAAAPLAAAASLQELVAAKLQLAQSSEREVVGRRELYKARETNMRLASKMTKLETLVYAKKK